MLVAAGVTAEDISAGLGIDDNTLRKHFAVELKTARQSANAQVVAAAFKQATVLNIPSTTIFWLKCRMGWREPQPGDNSGAVGIPDFVVQTSDESSDDKADSKAK
jgi:hypothetical protein